MTAPLAWIREIGQLAPRRHPSSMTTVMIIGSSGRIEDDMTPEDIEDLTELGIEVHEA